MKNNEEGINDSFLKKGIGSNIGVRIKSFFKKFRLILLLSARSTSPPMKPVNKLVSGISKKRIYRFQWYNIFPQPYRQIISKIMTNTRLVI